MASDGPSSDRGNDNSADNPPTTPDSPTSAGFPSDQLPPNTNTSNFSDDDEEDVAVDPEIIRDEADDIVEEEEDGEDLYNDDFLNDYRELGEQDQYEEEGLHDSVEDERDLDQIMQDRRAAELELEARDATFTNTRRIPQLLHDQDTDEESHRPAKRSRAGFRPPTGGRSNDDTMQIRVHQEDHNMVTPETMYP